MRRDSRLSGVLHVLLHMAEQNRPLTSEEMAKAMYTNPVVIRRVLAGLRDRGYIRSEKGHGGGWTLARDLSQVTLRDIYEALGKPTLLAIGNRTKNSDCLIEEAVNTALGKSFDDAEALLLARFGEITLEILRRDVFRRLKARGESLPGIEQLHGQI